MFCTLVVWCKCVFFCLWQHSRFVYASLCTHLWELRWTLNVWWQQWQEFLSSVIILPLRAWPIVDWKVHVPHDRADRWLGTCSVTDANHCLLPLCFWHFQHVQQLPVLLIHGSWLCWEEHCIGHRFSHSFAHTYIFSFQGMARWTLMNSWQFLVPNWCHQKAEMVFLETPSTAYSGRWVKTFFFFV